MSNNANEQVLEGLRGKFASPDEAVRKEALQKLVSLPPSEEMFALLANVASAEPSAELKFTARKAYDEIRRRVEEARLKRSQMMESQNSPVPQNEGASNCEQILLHGDRAARLKMIGMIAQKNEPRFLPVLLRALQEEQNDNFVISALVKVIGQLGGPSEIGVLQQYLRHEDSRVRSNTIEGLELIDDEHIFAVLVPMLTDSDNRVRGTTIKALMRFDEIAARKLILKLAAGSSEAMRASACYCLGFDSTPWAEHILLKMIQREASVPILKIESQVIMRIGTPISIAWFALQLQNAQESKASVYRTCLNTIVERLGIDQARVTDLRDHAAQGKFYTSIEEMDAGITCDSAKKKTSESPHSGEEDTPEPRPTEDVDSLSLTQVADAVDAEEMRQLSNSFEEDFGVTADLPEPSRETDNWDEPSVERIVSGTNPIKSAQKKPVFMDHGLGDGDMKKRRKAKEKEKAPLWKSVFNFSEGAGYLVPAIVMLVLFSIAGAAWVLSDRGGPQDVKIVRKAGDSVDILCRVRFVDKKKNHVTLCRGNEYFHGRFASDVDLSTIKVGALVKVKGVINGEKHLNAMVLEGDSIELSK